MSEKREAFKGQGLKGFGEVGQILRMHDGSYSERVGAMGHEVRCFLCREGALYVSV